MGSEAETIPKTAERAVSPVAGKALEAMFVVLYISLMITALYGGTVPEYRSTAGNEIAERTAANVVMEIEGAIPPETATAETETSVSLPSTIAGMSYRIEVLETELVLSHPNPEIGVRLPLVLSDRVVTIDGTSKSTDPASVVITRTDRGLVVSLR